MKICFIAPRAYQLFNPSIKSVFGGAEVQLSLLAKEVSTIEGIQTSFMVADFGQEKIETFDRVKVWRSINFQKNIFSQIFGFFSVFRKINADVYVQRTITPFSAIIGIYCKLKNKKFIYMVANDTETDGTHRIFTSKIKKWVCELCFSVATIIISQNSYQADNLLKRHKQNSILIRSGYPMPLSMDQLPEKDFHLWVGRAELIKQPFLFINLAKHFPGEQFVMICPQIVNGNTDYYQEIQSQAAELKNLRFIDFVPFAEIDTYFQQAKTFINTSETEGFPNTFIQAAKNATPVFSLEVNPDKLLDTYQFGIACHGSTEELQREFSSLISNEAKYAEMSKNAFKYAQEHHNIENIAHRLIELIQEI